MHHMLSDWLTSARRGQEPSGFCFIHFFNPLVWENKPPVFFLPGRILWLERRHEKKKSAPIESSGSFPSSVIRSLLEQMVEIFPSKNKLFLGCFTCRNWQKSSVICKSRGQQSDTSQLKFHYAANWVKRRIRPRIVKAFSLKEPGHDLSVQFLICHTRQLDSKLCPTCPFIHVVVPLITSWSYNFTHAGNKHRNKHPESEFGTEVQLFCQLKRQNLIENAKKIRENYVRGLTGLER